MLKAKYVAVDPQLTLPPTSTFIAKKSLIPIPQSHTKSSMTPFNNPKEGTPFHPETKTNTLKQTWIQSLSNIKSWSFNLVNKKAQELCSELCWGAFDLPKTTKLDRLFLRKEENEYQGQRTINNMKTPHDFNNNSGNLLFHSNVSTHSTSSLCFSPRSGIHIKEYNPNQPLCSSSMSSPIPFSLPPIKPFPKRRVPPLTRDAFRARHALIKAPVELGSLGVNREEDSFMEKALKVTKQKEYSERVRFSSKSMIKTQKSLPQLISTQSMNGRDPKEIAKASINRRKVLEYSKQIPKPPISQLLNQSYEVSSTLRESQSSPLPFLPSKSSLLDEHQRGVQMLKDIKRSLLL